MKSASCVIPLSYVQPVTSVKNVASNLPVGARLQNFWQTWLELGAGPKIVQILREGYTLPFRIRPNLTRSPTVVSRYVNPHRNSYLLEALHQLMDKNAVELVHNQTSLGFFNRLFLVPKPNNKWRPILDLSKLNLFLKVEKFKMETPETIRTSLQQGEWVTSVDFKDAYFHIPIQEQSRKYLRFHVQGRTYRQYYSGSLHKQGRRHEVGPTVCPTVENLDLVFPATSDSKSSTHPRPSQCDSRQTIQAGSDHPNRVVPPSGGFSTNMQQVALASNRSLCHEIQPQVASVCLSSTGLPGCSSGCTYPAMGRSGCIRLPTDRHIGQSGGEAIRLPVQETHSDCPGVAQHALVLGPSDHVQPGPSQPSQPAQSTNTALQSDPSQKSDQSKSPCLAPRATTIKEQGFSEAVAARIEAPQRRSTRSVYEAKWTIFTKWCVTNQVDFRAPPIKSVADFLMYLFEDKKLQPSTIDGYRSAIADKLGPTTVNISKDDNLTRLLESFHRDRPKGRRGIPSWNLSLVLHQLTKAPFEPLREASLKHLTFKTVFLLALGSGKRRSEIHAWQHKNIRHQSDWSKVSLFPSPSFLSKNQLAKEGPESVAPVVIPALAPTLDKSLKSDRSLCPVRALRYYLDRTSDLRQSKELVFVSFKKGFDKDISPATISSWIKQTVILCYELSDQQAHTLHQVKAHDVRAFAASKAFQSGVSLEQILAACHWKSHNTFTQFYLKDVAWADSELYHLGPVVAAQQIHQQTGT